MRGENGVETSTGEDMDNKEWYRHQKRKQRQTETVRLTRTYTINQTQAYAAMYLSTIRACIKNTSYHHTEPLLSLSLSHCLCSCSLRFSTHASVRLHVSSFLSFFSVSLRCSSCSSCSTDTNVPDIVLQAFRHLPITITKSLAPLL